MARRVALALFLPYYELAADNLGKIGISVELKPEEYGKYISTTYLGKFEKMAMGLSTPFTEVDDFLYGSCAPRFSRCFGWSTSGPRGRRA